MTKHAELVEQAAQRIYNIMTYHGNGDKPQWVAGGNSFMQDKARVCATAALKSQPFNVKEHLWDGGKITCTTDPDKIVFLNACGDLVGNFGYDFSVYEFLHKDWQPYTPIVEGSIDWAKEQTVPVTNTTCASHNWYNFHTKENWKGQYISIIWPKTGWSIWKEPRKPELKPCPFCGGVAKAINIDDGWSVQCTNCCCEGEFIKERNCNYAGESKILAIKSWNTRIELEMPEGETL